MSPCPHLKLGVVFTSEGCCNDYCMHLNNLAQYLEPKFCSKRTAITTILKVHIVFVYMHVFLK